jgi:hypothetical protein
MWILVTQIYWKDLLRLRRYGRRLVAGMLTHLNTVCAARPQTGRRRLETNMSGRSIKTPIETSWRLLPAASHLYFSHFYVHHKTTSYPRRSGSSAGTHYITRSRPTTTQRRLPSSG